MLIRCRGSGEAGLAFTAAECVQRVRFDGTGVSKALDYETPSELPIHGEMYLARLEVNAVVHAHPRATLICALAGLPLKPIFGSFDTRALGLAEAGVPVFPRSILIRDRALGQELATAMKGKAVCVMRGHGITTVGATVEEATLRAIQLETLASITLEIATAGGAPESMSEADREYFRKLRETQDSKQRAHGQDVYTWTWRHYVKLLEAQGTRHG